MTGKVAPDGILLLGTNPDEKRNNSRNEINELFLPGNENDHICDQKPSGPKKKDRLAEVR
jgi:hypothetical protein